MEIIRCKRVNISGSQVIDSAPYGIVLKDCSDSLITGTTILDSRETGLMKAAIQWTGSGTGNMIANCRIGKGTQAAVLAGKNIQQNGNLLDE